MFENPGEKIKKASKILFCLGLIASAILMFLGLISARGLYILYSLLLAFAIYLNSLLIYGFGVIVDKFSTDDTKSKELK